MKTVTVLAAASLLATPFAASAEISGGVGLSYGSISVDGASENIDNTRLDFDVSYDTGGAFGFGLNGGTNRFSADGDSFTVNTVSGEAFYAIGSGYKLGAYAGVMSFDEASDENLKSYGLFLGTSGDAFEVDLSLGKFELDGNDANELKVRGTYDLSQKTMLSGEFGRLWEDGESVNTFAVGVTHDLSDQFSVFGGLSSLSFTDEDERMDSISVGVAYDLASISSFGATGWLELSRSRFDGDTVNQVAFGISMPLGDAAGAPVGTNVGSIARGNRSAGADLFNNLLFGSK